MSSETSPAASPGFSTIAPGLAVGGPGAELDDFPEPVLLIDPNGRLIKANAEAIDLAHRVGAPLENGHSIVALLGKLRVANAGGTTPWIPLEGDGWVNGLADLAAAQPAESIFEMKTTPRKDRDGRLSEYVVRLADRTSFAEALRGRNAAEGHRDRFLKLLSHDMRSPLAAILATLKHPDLSAVSNAQLGVIEESAIRALAMIDATVRLTRAESADYRFVELDFCHVVEEAIDACWAKAKNARVKIVLDPCDEFFPIFADRGYLTDALGELLLNLIGKSDEGQKLSCSLTTDSLNDRPAVTLCVRYAGKNDETREGPGGVDELGNASDKEGRLELFRTVISRHDGVVRHGLDAGLDTVSVTFPIVNLDERSR